MRSRTSRRKFLLTIGAAAPALAAVASNLLHAAEGTTGSAAQQSAGTASTGGPFTLPPLGYAYEALEPTIDAQTMRLHHGKHHAAYVENLNKAIAAHPELANWSLEKLLTNLSAVPASAQTAVRNHGGGHWNHTFFWKLMTPGGAKQPSGELADAIQSTFGDFANFKRLFEEAGAKVFGSGWVWLVRTPEGKLQITTTPNQDTPISSGLTPVLGNDVWEHAYYLKYQNRRGEYLKAWWNVVNWDVAAANFAQK
ncbi:MAG: superoxide dismutase [Candidatus Hydrogenedentota bacterium]|nr:MAG: superoxide dismutase [Candidatus Hydrogenedentota bacterium]